MNSLQQLFLDNNNFSSVPPSFPSGLKSLQTFSISENPGLPPWSVPDSLTESSSLVTVYATRCGLMGTLSDIFGSFPNLQSIRLSYNNLTGPLPPVVFQIEDSEFMAEQLRRWRLGEVSLLRCVDDGGRIRFECGCWNITYNGYKLDEFCAERTSAYVGQTDNHIAELTEKLLTLLRD